MSKGYYIYLDQRDVGKGDMHFLGWANENDEEMTLMGTPTNYEECVAVFSPSKIGMVYRDVEMIGKTFDAIENKYPELKGEIHVGIYEEDEGHD